MLCGGHEGLYRGMCACRYEHEHVYCACLSVGVCQHAQRNNRCFVQGFSYEMSVSTCLYIHTHTHMHTYMQAIGKDPMHFKAFFNRGFSYDKIGDYDKAIDDYTKAVQLDSSSAYAYYNR